MAEIIPTPDSGTWFELDQTDDVWTPQPDSGTWFELVLQSPLPVTATRQLGLGRGVRGLG